MYVPDNRMIMAQIIKNKSYVNKLKSTNDELLTWMPSLLGKRLLEAAIMHRR